MPQPTVKPYIQTGGRLAPILNTQWGAMGMTNNSKLSRSGANQVRVAEAEIAATYHQGPIPDAQQLSLYEKTCPGAADRIITMAEKQSLHRQNIETLVIRSNARNSTLGVVFAFMLGLTTISGGVFLAFNDHELFGALFGSAGIAGLVGVHIWNTLQ